MINYKKLGLSKDKAIEILSGRETILIKTEWFRIFRKLGGERTLLILEAIEKLYCTMEAEPIDDEQADTAFSMMLPALEVFIYKYLNTSVKNAEKAEIRWRNKNKNTPSVMKDEKESDAVACHSMQVDAVDAHTHNSYSSLFSSSDIGVNSVRLSSDEAEERPPFNLIIFGKLVREVYEKGNYGGWEVNDFINIFAYFFHCYHEYSGTDHPFLNRENIEKIMESMTFSYSENGHEFEYFPDDYPKLIDKYFEQDFQKSNRNINHFFSGSIRANLSYSIEREEEVMT